MSDATTMEDWSVQSACGCAAVATAYFAENVFTSACPARRQCARHAVTCVTHVERQCLQIEILPYIQNILRINMMELYFEACKKHDAEMLMDLDIFDTPTGGFFCEKCVCERMME